MVQHDMVPPHNPHSEVLPIVVVNVDALNDMVYDLRNPVYDPTIQSHNNFKEVKFFKFPKNLRNRLVIWNVSRIHPYDFVTHLRFAKIKILLVILKAIKVGEFRKKTCIFRSFGEPERFSSFGCCVDGGDI